jgi:hypothetical protein
LAVAAGFAAATPAGATDFSYSTDSYMAGDFHNHTTCTDGSTSIETLVKKSINDFGLEWMAQAGHGGTTVRDCRLDDPEFDSSKTGSGRLIEDAVGIAAIQGDVSTTTTYSPDGAAHRVMWRWQSIRDIVFPEISRLSKELRNPMLYVGLETNVPGHEHVSTTVLGEQRPWAWWKGGSGNANAMSEFEYRFDRSDTDRSGPGGTPGVIDSGIWKGKVANASGTGSGTVNHLTKAVPSVAWMQANYPLDSYYVPAHVERAGVFNPNGNNGFNIEHFRDFNNAGPTVAVGFETMPGHQASTTRGEYRAGFCGTGCDSVGVTTFGGTGIYGAKIGGVWDAMLGEGRNWFFYASSDWHNRGTFSPYVRQSTQDFYPGEYQKLYIPRPDEHSFWHQLHSLRPQYIVDSVRNGDSFSVTGDLIGGELSLTAEVEGEKRFNHFGWWDHIWKKEAKMGETLVVPRGKSVRITLTVTDPSKPNNSPYSFNNPSLLQVGIKQPLNKPVLDHVDFIRGQISGVIPPGDPKYTHGTNPSAALYATFNKTKWQKRANKLTMSFVIPNIQSNQYVRVRGTNLPAGTPNETDAAGNPLSDLPQSVIPCVAECPAHMQTDANGNKVSSFDVAAWADLWFYTNPIFIRVQGTERLLVEKNHDLAEKLASK